MRGIAELLGELLERLELQQVTLVMNDWGGPQLLVGGRHDARIARLALCSCEAFDNVPPKGAARLLPYLARVPGGIAAAVMPFRFDRLRRLPVTYGPLSRRPVPRDVMDRWFAPCCASERSAAICASTCSAPPGPARPARGGRRAARVRPPRARRVGQRRPPDATRPRPTPRRAAAAGRARGESPTPATPIPEDQPVALAAHLRELLAR